MMEEPLGEAAFEAMAEAEDVVGIAHSGQPAAPAPPDHEGMADVGQMAGRTAEATRPEAKPPAKPTARFLTITIVMATFIAALGGFLLNRASANASNAGDMAQELSLQGSAAETSAYQQAESDYSQYLSLQSLKAQADQEMLEATYDQADASTWADLYRAASAQAEQTSAAVPSDLHPYLANGDPDPDFPYDFFAKRASGGTYLEAKSNAYNDVSDQWSRLVDAYTAILTMIAVALFLFGSAYVLYGRNRIFFTVLGGLLVGTGLVWGGGLAITREPGTPSGAAASDYANGVTAMDEVATPAGYEVAIDDFTDAIKLRPDYALAYAERAAAEAFRGSEALGAGFVSNVSPHWARLSAADELEAYRLGDHDAGQVLNVGWSYYTLWIVGGGVGRPPGLALDFFRQAAGLDPTNPVDLLDTGLAELAMGQYKAAAGFFTAGVTHMLYDCPAGSRTGTCTTPQPPTSYGLQRAWLAGGMEALEALAQSREAVGSVALRTAITDAQGLLAGSMAAGKVMLGPYKKALTVTGLSAFLDPNYLELDVPVPRGTTAYRMAGMPLTVLWYERPSRGARWSAISETACWGHGQQVCGRYESRYNIFQFVTRFLAADDQCFTDVEYRAELYVGGTLAASSSLGPKDDYIGTNLAPALSKAMNIGICTPSSWHLQALPRLTFPVYGTSATVTGTLSSSELSYASADRKEGVYLFRVYPPRTSPDGAPLNVQNVVETGLDYAVKVLKGRGLPADMAPLGPPSPDGVWGPAVADMVTTGYASRSTGTEAFVGAAVVAPYGAEAGAAAQDNSIAANVTGDYAVVVTIVYGPVSSQLWAGPHSLGLQVFSSWSLLDYG
jgi:tetratricopeptide (TPR) repeat protein